MESDATSRRFVSWRALVVFGLAVVLMLAFSAPVGADGDDDDDDGGPHRVTISGDSTPSDCNDGAGAGAIYLTGDIEGCLTFFPTRYTCDELNGFDRYREWGRETFEGSLDGEPGTFGTKYDLEATYASGFCDAVEAGGFPFELQLTGGCNHYIKGKTGAFKRARGLITFFDVIPDPGESGASNYLWAGYLTHRGRD